MTPGAGVLAPALSNPVQSPYDPALAAQVEAANAKEKASRSGLQQALFRAAALRGQPLFAKGGGPLGIRIGEGPGGWAVSIGDLIGGLMAKKRLDESTQGVTSGMEQLAPAESASDAALNAARRQFVPQGTMMSNPFSLGGY